MQLWTLGLLVLDYEVTWSDPCQAGVAQALYLVQRSKGRGKNSLRSHLCLRTHLPEVILGGGSY